VADLLQPERRQKFLREVGSVVLGVLIALGIGEVADAVRWQVRVRNSVAAMRQESAGNRFNVVERLLQAPCVDRKLRDIARVLHDAQRTGRLPPIAEVGRPSIRVVETASYDMALSDGTPMHMDRGDARDVALAYQLGARNWADHAAREQDGWATLSLLQQPGGPVDGNVLATLLEVRARMAATAEQVLSLAKEADRFYANETVPVEYGAYRDLHGLADATRRRAICRPLR
jgi:hypothetical protein